MPKISNTIKISQKQSTKATKTTKLMMKKRTNKQNNNEIRQKQNTPCPEKNGPSKQNAVTCTIYNTIQ